MFKDGTTLMMSLLPINLLLERLWFIALKAPKIDSFAEFIKKSKKSIAIQNDF